MSFSERWKIVQNLCRGEVRRQGALHVVYGDARLWMQVFPSVSGDLCNGILVVPRAPHCQFEIRPESPPEIWSCEIHSWTPRIRLRTFVAEFPPSKKPARERFRCLCRIPSARDWEDVNPLMEGCSPPRWRQHWNVSHPSCSPFEGRNSALNRCGRDSSWFPVQKVNDHEGET